MLGNVGIMSRSFHKRLVICVCEFVLVQLAFYNISFSLCRYLDHNQISAIDERAFQGFGNLTNL